MLSLEPVNGQTANLVKIQVTAPASKGEVTLPSQVDGEIELHYRIDGKDLASVDETSLRTSDKPSLTGMWKLGYSNVSNNGTQALFTIKKSGDYLNKVEAVKVTGSIKVRTSSETKVLKQALIVGGESTQIGNYQVTAKKVKVRDGSEVTQLTLEGDPLRIKNVGFKQSGKRVDWHTYKTKGELRTYTLGLVDGSVEVTLIYWSSLQSSIVNFSK